MILQDTTYINGFIKSNQLESVSNKTHNINSESERIISVDFSEADVHIVNINVAVSKTELNPINYDTSKPHQTIIVNGVGQPNGFFFATHAIEVNYRVENGIVIGRKSVNIEKDKYYIISLNSKDNRGFVLNEYIKDQFIFGGFFVSDILTIPKTQRFTLNQSDNYTDLEISLGFNHHTVLVGDAFNITNQIKLSDIIVGMVYTMTVTNNKSTDITLNFDKTFKEDSVKEIGITNNTIEPTNFVKANSSKMLRFVKMREDVDLLFILN